MQNFLRNFQNTHTHDRQTVRWSSIFSEPAKMVDQVKFGPTEGCCFFCNSLHFWNFVKNLMNWKFFSTFIWIFQKWKLHFFLFNFICMLGGLHVGWEKVNSEIFTWIWHVIETAKVFWKEQVLKLILEHRELQESSELKNNRKHECLLFFSCQPMNYPHVFDTPTMRIPHGLWKGDEHVRNVQYLWIWQHLNVIHFHTPALNPYHGLAVPPHPSL